MNDPEVLDLYTQLVVFKTNTSTEKALFENPSHRIQDTLHALARKLKLEYEYSLQSRQIQIPRSSGQTAPSSTNVTAASFIRFLNKVVFSESESLVHTFRIAPGLIPYESSGSSDSDVEITPYFAFYTIIS